MAVPWKIYMFYWFPLTKKAFSHPLCWQALQYGFWGLVSHGLVYSHRYIVQRQDLLLWGAGGWCRTGHDFVPRFHRDLKWGRGWTSSKLCTSNLFLLIWSQLRTLFCLYKCSFPDFCGSHVICSLFDLALEIVTFNVNNCGVALASIPTSCWLHDMITVYNVYITLPMSLGILLVTYRSLDVVGSKECLSDEALFQAGRHSTWSAFEGQRPETKIYFQRCGSLVFMWLDLCVKRWF